MAGAVTNCTSDRPMAPGVGGFNIDLPAPKASRVEGEVAIAHTRRQALPNPSPLPQAPIRAQRMALIVEGSESSLIPRLLAVIAIAGVILLMFREETRKQLNDVLEAAMSSYKVSSVETSAHQPRLVIENQKGVRKRTTAPWHFGQRRVGRRNPDGGRPRGGHRAVVRHFPRRDCLARVGPRS